MSRPIDNETIAAYWRGVESGTMKSATPNVVRQLLDEINRLRDINERQTDYSISLQRLIEAYCGGRDLEPFMKQCPHHTDMLNKRRFSEKHPF